MLVEIERLNIVNDGYRRSISISRMYVNSDHIVSISDYSTIKDFLISESLDVYEKGEFSLIRMTSTDRIEDIIVLGTSEDLFNKFNKSSKKVLLNE
jgi:hypothetical protein